MGVHWDLVVGVEALQGPANHAQGPLVHRMLRIVKISPLVRDLARGFIGKRAVDADDQRGNLKAVLNKLGLELLQSFEPVPDAPEKGGFAVAIENCDNDKDENEKDNQLAFADQKRSDEERNDKEDPVVPVVVIIIISVAPIGIAVVVIVVGLHFCPGEKEQGT